MVTKAVAKKSTVAKKAPAKRGTTNAPTNPYQKGDDKFNVAALLLKKGPHSWEELKDANGGVLSTRTMGFVIRDLEANGARFEKYRDPEYGTCYTLTPGAARLANTDGPDATGEHKVPVRKAAAKKGKKAGPTPKAALAKKVANKRAAGTTAAKKAPAKKAAPVKAAAKKAPVKKAAAAKATASKKATAKPIVKKRIGAKKG